MLSLTAPKTQDNENGKLHTTRDASIALVVDDDPYVLAITGEILRKFGFRVVEAPTFEAALDAWRMHAGHFSILVIDYNLGPRLGI